MFHLVLLSHLYNTRQCMLFCWLTKASHCIFVGVCFLLLIKFYTFCNLFYQSWTGSKSGIRKWKCKVCSITVAQDLLGNLIFTFRINNAFMKIRSMLTFIHISNINKVTVFHKDRTVIQMWTKFVSSS